MLEILVHTETVNISDLPVSVVSKIKEIHMEKVSAGEKIYGRQ